MFVQNRELWRAERSGEDTGRPQQRAAESELSQRSLQSCATVLLPGVDLINGLCCSSDIDLVQRSVRWSGTTTKMSHLHGTARGTRRPTRRASASLDVDAKSQRRLARYRSRGISATDDEGPERALSRGCEYKQAKFHLAKQTKNVMRTGSHAAVRFSTTGRLHQHMGNALISFG